MSPVSVPLRRASPRHQTRSRYVKVECHRRLFGAIEIPNLDPPAMIRRALGSTGIDISSVILGCGTFGGIGGAKELIGRGLDRAASLAALDEGLALGINVLDTAERYAGGESELIIGEWLRNQSVAAISDLHIATKVAPPFYDGGSEKRFDRKFIEQKLALSLERLGVNSVDFYLSHAPDPETSIEHTLEGFAAVMDSKRVRHIGCCNVSRTQLCVALDASDRLGFPAFEWVQNSFSLLNPKADEEIREVCLERHLGFTPFSPLAGGVLSGKYRSGEAYPPDSRMALYPTGFDHQLTDRTFKAIDQLKVEAAGRGVSTAALALAWVLNHPQCTATVIGPSRTSPHLAHLAQARGIELTPEQHVLMAGWFSAS